MSLENLMKPKIDLVRAEMKNINFYHVTKGTYEGGFSDAEAKIEYTNLLNALPEIPGLSEEEIEILKEEIQHRISMVGTDMHHAYNIDTIKNVEDFKKAIEKVHYEHRYDAGAMMGTLTPQEAERDYKAILSLVDEVKGLTDKEKEELRAEIQTKLENIPQVQQEKREEREAYDEELNREFEAAKARFASLSFFERRKLKKAKKAPENQDLKFMTVDDVKRLYK